MLKLCQPSKHLSCCEYFPAEIPIKVNRNFIIIVPQPITFIILYSLYGSQSWLPRKAAHSWKTAGSYQ